MKKTINIKAKRLIASALSSVMCLTIVSSSALAETIRDTSNLTSAKNDALVETGDGENYVTIDDCRCVGKKWIIANYSESTEIREIIPIKNLNNYLTGYCINFSTDGVPNGYLVLDANKFAENHIKEFALDGNGIYDTLTAEIPTKGRAAAIAAPVIYSTDPFQYAVKYYQGDEVLFYNSDSRVMTIADEVTAYERGDSLDHVEFSQQSDGISSQKPFTDAFFDAMDLRFYTWSSEKSILNLENLYPATTESFSSLGKNNKCGPIAALNICKYYNSCRNKTNMLKNRIDRDTYLGLIDAMGFDPTGEGGVTFGNMISGLRSYISSRGYAVTIEDYSLDLWSDFVQDFENDNPIIVAILGLAYNDKGELKKTGHMAVGVGYRVFNDEDHFIQVCDGWYSTVKRYLNFDAYELNDLWGAAVRVS